MKINKCSGYTIIELMIIGGIAVTLGIGMVLIVVIGHYVIKFW